MIKLKLKRREELTALYWFITNYRKHLPEIGNVFYNELLDGILNEIELKIGKKIYSDSEKFIISLKKFEAIAFYTLWMDSTLARPGNDHYFYNIVSQKMNQIHQKIS